MRDTISLKNISHLAEQLKSIVEKCEKENSLMLQIISNIRSNNSYQCSSIHSQEWKASGDNEDNHRRKKLSNTNLNFKSSHKEHLSMLIKNAAKENLKLRESNIRLKQESKIQDKNIRDLNHKIMIYERNNHEKESQKKLIRDLKMAVDEKATNILLLEKKLKNVKILLSKEKNKTKIFEESKKKSSKTKVTWELKSNVEELLAKIELLLQEGKQKRNTSFFSDKHCIEKTLNTLKKLMKLSSKQNIDEEDFCKNFDEYPGNNLNGIPEMLILKNDIGVQTSD